MRWLIAIAALLVLVGVGWVAVFNAEPVVLHLGPVRTHTLPLAQALLVAFAAGALVVGLTAGMQAGARGLRRWQAARRAQRQSEQARAMAHARRLAWTGEHAQARAAILRGTPGLPEDAIRTALVAESYLAEDEPATARALLEQGIARFGNDVRLLDLLAQAASATGESRAAIEAIERARLAEPESPRLMRRLRDLYAAESRWEDARALQEQLLLRMHTPAALAAEERVLRGFRYEAALVDPEPRRGARRLVGITREAPDFVPAFVSAGDLLARDGRTFAARRVWERGLRHQPAAVLLDRLAQLWVGTGRADRAARVYRRTMRRHPEAEALPLLLARHLLAQGEMTEAATVLDGVPAPAADRPATLLLRAELLRRQQQPEPAADAYARALAGTATGYRCTSCRAVEAEWTGCCPSCRQWDTLRMTAEGG